MKAGAERVVKKKTLSSSMFDSTFDASRNLNQEYIYNSF